MTEKMRLMKPLLKVTCKLFSVTLVLVLLQGTGTAFATSVSSKNPPDILTEAEKTSAQLQKITDTFSNIPMYGYIITLAAPDTGCPDAEIPSTIQPTSESPKTGDNSSVWQLAAIFILSLLFLLLCLALRRERSNE